LDRFGFHRNSGRKLWLVIVGHELDRVVRRVCRLPLFEDLEQLLLGHAMGFELLLEPEVLAERFVQLI